MIESEHVSHPLRPYDPATHGGWTERHATHLLWRAQCGASYQEIERATQAGLQATLDHLLTPQEESAEFQSTEGLLRRLAVDTGNIANLRRGGCTA